jgi:hypothetical protein
MIIFTSVSPVTSKVQLSSDKLYLIQCNVKKFVCDQIKVEFVYHTS